MKLINIPQQIKQPDGKIINCFASGNEYFNCLHDKNGYIIIQNQTNGFYYYAKYIDEELFPSDRLVTESSLNNLNIKSLYLDAVTIKDIKVSINNFQFHTLANNEITNAPNTGTINNLVVFIRFSDESEFTDLISTYDDMFNNSTANVNSMYNYFKETSYSKLFITSHFYPQPPSTTVLSYQDTNPRAYYQPYNAITNPIGYQGGNNGIERTNREQILLKNAVNSISSQVNPALNIDADNDGYVDNICFIVKGAPDGWSSLLWPHKWTLFSQNAYINGKKVGTYNLQLQAVIEVGVLCHEMQHSVGFSDLYHYNSDGLNPVGVWDLMQFVYNPPEHSCAYAKYRYGKWIASIPEITGPGKYTLNPLTSPINNSYLIRTGLSSTQYFVVEYRKRNTIFEDSLPGSGLLVYRIDTSRDGQGNAWGPPDEVYVFRPGGTTTSNGSYLDAYLTCDVGRTSIGGSANPLFLSDGTPTEIKITNVTSAQDTISFNLNMEESMDLSISKIASSTIVNLGDIVEYNIVVTNNTDCRATNVVVVDTLPADVEYISATSTQGVCSYIPNTVTCNIGDLDGNTSVTITIRVKTLQIGSISNTSTVTADDLTEGRSSTAVVTVINVVDVDLSISKIASPTIVNTGDSLEYNIVVTNNSNNKATNVIVVDTLPDDVEYISATSTQGVCSYIPNTVTCDIGDLDGNTSVTITIRVKTLIPGLISNTATVTADNLTEDRSSTAVVIVINVIDVDLSISKIASPDIVYVGDILEYSIAVTNISNAKATNVIVIDDLPTNVEFISAESTKGTCSYIPNTVTCTVGDLDGNTRVTITIKVKALIPGSISNTATVTAENLAENRSSSIVSNVNSISNLSTGPVIRCDVNQKLLITIQNTRNEEISMEVCIKNLDNYPPREYCDSIKLKSYQTMVLEKYNIPNVYEILFYNVKDGVYMYITADFDENKRNCYYDNFNCCESNTFRHSQLINLYSL